MYGGSGAWGDYDGDGDLDVLLTGDDGSYLHAAVYENRAGVFISASTHLVPVRSGSGTWGDYDGDGDLDILLTGEGGSGPLTRIYENQAGVFAVDVAASTDLPGVYLGSAAWGDYDNDGDLDILLTGDEGFHLHAAVYENRAGVFVPDAAASANLVGVYRSGVGWGDYDGDGDLDIVLTGRGSGLIPQAWIYRNDDCPQADLEVIKTVDPPVVKPDGTLTYTVSVTNHGPLETTIITVTDVLSGGMFIDILVKPGWDCAGGAGWMTCAYTVPLPTGGAEAIRFWAQAPSGSGRVTNTVRVESDRDDWRPADNTAAIAVAVTRPPVAVAGPDEGVFVDASVVLVSASFDPDGNEPLAHAWVQTGGPPVSLHGAASPAPYFTAPGTPTVLSFTLWVTDALGMGCERPDAVTITVTDRTVVGLAAANDSPTEVGRPVHFTAAVTQGTNVSYTWAFGDGVLGVGRRPDHIYGTVGVYTAVVTAANSAGVLTATTAVTVTESRLYLPVMMRGDAAGDRVRPPGPACG